MLDFVAAWYIKGAHYARLNHALRVGYVSTNSIVQGEQVGVLWSWMRAQGMHTHFAHQTFKWSNEASGKAAVHCVIVGFAAQESAEKWIYEYAQIDGEPLAVQAQHINPYLVDAADAFLVSRRQSICPVPPVVFGSMPNDGGHLFLDDEEKTALLQECPTAAAWVRPFLGADEFIRLYSRNAQPIGTLIGNYEPSTNVLGFKHRNLSFRHLPGRQLLAATGSVRGKKRIHRTSSGRQGF